jgi:hypothetical protein
VKKSNPLPEDAINRFFQNVETRAWTDAEKELGIIREKAEDTAWFKGYLKALEGLLLTYRSNDDKYIYLPKVLSNPLEESINQLRKNFGEFATNEIHGEYDRGYFKALEDYVNLLSKLRIHPTASQVSSPELERKIEEPKKDAGLTPYLAESS